MRNAEELRILELDRTWNKLKCFKKIAEYT